MSQPSNPLQGAEFALAAHKISQMPNDTGAEVAFAGRSNAGKSSALNALTAHKGLARTSKTPGRTQQLVVFSLAPKLDHEGKMRTVRLIDLPGYGYAKVPVDLRDHWKMEIDNYLHQRESLHGLVLIVDIRHPLKEFDRLMLNFCAHTRLPCHVLLTKADKISKGQAGSALLALRREFEAEGWHNASAQIFSSSEKTGVDEARAKVLALLLSNKND